MENEWPTLSDRLRYALNLLGISQTDLAKKINVKPQIIQYLCSSRSLRSKFTFNIAEALGIDVSWLAIGKGIQPCLDQSLVNSNSNLVPVLTYKQIKQLSIDNVPVNKEDINDWIVSSVNNNLEYFGIKLNDTSMSPKFEIDTIIIIEPVLNAQKKQLQNQYVLVFLINQNCLVFRQLVLIEDKHFLIPLNEILYKKVALKNEDKIVGICKEARWLV
jgi:transcriptional regulator with XRE-family HTH domain